MDTDGIVNVRTNYDEFELSEWITRIRSLLCVLPHTKNERFAVAHACCALRCSNIVDKRNEGTKLSAREKKAAGGKTQKNVSRAVSDKSTMCASYFKTRCSLCRQTHLHLHVCNSGVRMQINIRKNSCSLYTLSYMVCKCIGNILYIHMHLYK